MVGAAHGASRPAQLLSLPVIGLFGYALVPANVFLYGINDIFDAEIDAHNPKKAAREQRFRGDPLVVGAVVCSGLLGVGLVGLLATRSVRAASLLLVFFALAIEYSAPPLRFKTTPGLDSVSNGLYILPGIAAYSLLAGTGPPILVLLGGWLWTMAMHTLSAVPDIEADRAGGIQTTATVLGARGSLGYVGVCWLATAVCFGLLDARAGLLLGLYPVFVLGLGLSRLSVERAYWWFPALNTVVGAVLTMAGLWGLLYG